MNLLWDAPTLHISHNPLSVMSTAPHVVKEGRLVLHETHATVPFLGGTGYISGTTLFT